MRTPVSAKWENQELEAQSIYAGSCKILRLKLNSQVSAALRCFGESKISEATSGGNVVRSSSITMRSNANRSPIQLDRKSSLASPGKTPRGSFAVRNTSGRSSVALGPVVPTFDLSRTYLGTAGLFPLVPVFLTRWFDGLKGVNLSGCGLDDMSVNELALCLSERRGGARFIVMLNLDSNNLSMAAADNLKRLKRCISPAAMFSVEKNPSLLESLTRTLSASPNLPRQKASRLSIDAESSNSAVTSFSAAARATTSNAQASPTTAGQRVPRSTSPFSATLLPADCESDSMASPSFHGSALAAPAPSIIAGSTVRLRGASPISGVDAAAAFRRSVREMARNHELLDRRAVQTSVLSFAIENPGPRWFPMPTADGWLTLGCLFSLPTFASNVEREICILAVRKANRVLRTCRVCIVPVFLQGREHESGAEKSCSQAARQHATQQAFLQLGVSIVFVFASEHCSPHQLDHWEFAERNSIFSQQRCARTTVVPFLYRRKFTGMPRVFRASSTQLATHREILLRARAHFSAFGATCFAQAYSAKYKSVHSDGYLTYSAAISSRDKNDEVTSTQWSNNTAASASNPNQSQPAVNAAALAALANHNTKPNVRSTSPFSHNNDASDDGASSIGSKSKKSSGSPSELGVRFLTATLVSDIVAAAGKIRELCSRRTDSRNMEALSHVGLPIDVIIKQQSEASAVRASDSNGWIEFPREDAPFARADQQRRESVGSENRRSEASYQPGAARVLLQEVVAGFAAVVFLPDDPPTLHEMKIAAREQEDRSALCVQCRNIFPRTLWSLREAIWLACGLPSAKLPSKSSHLDQKPRTNAAQGTNDDDVGDELFALQLASHLSAGTRIKTLFLWDLDCIDNESNNTSVVTVLWQLTHAFKRRGLRVVALMDCSADKSPWQRSGLQLLDLTRVSDSVLEKAMNIAARSRNATSTIHSDLTQRVWKHRSVGLARIVTLLIEDKTTQETESRQKMHAETYDSTTITTVSDKDVISSFCDTRLLRLQHQQHQECNSSALNSSKRSSIDQSEDEITQFMKCVLYQRRVALPLLLVKYRQFERYARNSIRTQRPSGTRFDRLQQVQRSPNALSAVLFAPDIDASDDDKILQLLVEFREVLDWSPFLDFGLWNAPLVLASSALEKQVSCANVEANAIMKEIAQRDSWRLLDTAAYPLSLRFIALLCTTDLERGLGVLSTRGIARAASAQKLNALVETVLADSRSTTTTSDMCPRTASYLELLNKYQSLLQIRSSCLFTTFVRLSDENVFYKERYAALAQRGHRSCLVPLTDAPSEVAHSKSASSSSDKLGNSDHYPRSDEHGGHDDDEEEGDTRDESPHLEFIPCPHAIFCFLRTATSKSAFNAHFNRQRLCRGELAMFLPLETSPKCLQTHRNVISDAKIVSCKQQQQIVLVRVCVSSCTDGTVVVVEADTTRAELCIKFRYEADGIIPVRISAVAIGGSSDSRVTLTKPPMAVAGADSSLTVCGLTVGARVSWVTFPSVTRKVVYAAFMRDDIILCTVDCVGSVLVWGSCGSPASGLVLCSIALADAPILVVPHFDFASEIVAVLPSVVVVFEVTAQGCSVIGELALHENFVGTVAAGALPQILVCQDMNAACIIEFHEHEISVTHSFSPSRSMTSKCLSTAADSVRADISRRAAASSHQRPVVSASVAGDLVALRDADHRFFVFCDGLASQLDHFNNFAFDQPAETDRVFVFENPPCVCFTNNSHIFWWKVQGSRD